MHCGLRDTARERSAAGVEPGDLASLWGGKEPMHGCWGPPVLSGCAGGIKNEKRLKIKQRRKKN